MYLILILAAILFIVAFTYFLNQENFWWKKILKAILVAIGTVMIYAFFYQWGMASFEGVDKSYVQSVQVVVESITTAGYGGDSPWQSIEMNIFVLLMNMTGVVMVFFAVPLFVVPLIREAFEKGAPTEISLSGHVIISSQTTKAMVLADELTSKSIPFVIVDDNEEKVVRLHKRGVNAVYGDPSKERVLKNISIENAQAIVADMGDEINSIIALAAKKINPNLQIITVASSEKTEKYHRYAGASDVILPRNVLGTSLANKALVKISKELQGITKLGEELEIAELLVEPGSVIEKQSFFETGLLSNNQPKLIGAWIEGVFEPNPDDYQEITSQTILLVSGSHKDLLELRKKTVSYERTQDGDVLIAGYGLVGRLAAHRFKEKEVSFTVIDKMDKEGVDLVGDVTDEELLKAAEIEDAPSIILALNSDKTAIYCSLIIKQISPATEIIARVNDINNMENLYRAGADYVLSLSAVSGRMIFSSLEKSELILSADTTYEVVRTRAAKLVKIAINTDKIRQNTGATLIAIERDGQMIFELDEGIEIAPDDTIIVVGSDQSVNRFRKMYC